MRLRRALPGFLLAEAGAGLRRHLTLTIAVVVSVAVSLSLLGVALLLGRQVEVNKDYWYDRVEVSVFLCGEASRGASPACPAGAVTAEQRAAVEAQLRALPQVQDVFYESQQEAYARAREMPGLRALSESVTAAALPESFRVKLHDARDYAAVGTAVARAPGVETVEDQRQLLEPLFNLLGKLQAGALIFALVQLTATVLLVANTIRVAAFTRRRETGIMRLVGASRWSISLPFLLEGALAGLVGAALACAALSLGYRLLVVDWLAPRLPLVEYVGWADVAGTLPVVLGVGVGLCALASIVTLRRHVRV